jgi:hypothetical protein
VAQLWSQASAGVASKPEADDHFGGAFSVGDFNGDAFADLAIGVTLEDFTSQCDYWGAVQVLYGSNAGLQATGVGGPAAQLWWQASPGVAGEPETFDGFGSRLSSGDFNGDSFADLAISAPDDEAQGQDSAGVVHVLYGSNIGVQAAGYFGPGAQTWSQSTPGVLDEPEQFDIFGASLAAGDFDGDGFADLAIGAPGEDDFAGVVHILRGSNVGLRTLAIGVVSLLWSQASAGVAGGPEADDSFGSSLAIGDFNGDGFADLAIGAPGKTLASSPRESCIPSTARTLACRLRVWEDRQPSSGRRRALAAQAGRKLTTSSAPPWRASGSLVHLTAPTGSARAALRDRRPAARSDDVDRWPPRQAGTP